MAVAASNVGVTFTLRGQGNAAQHMRGVAKASDGLGSSIQRFGEVGDTAAARSGKLSTALSSLGDFAGRSEGRFRMASEAAGAFDDVLTILPGPIGIAAGAVAGLTAVLLLQEQAAKQDREAFAQAFSPDVAQQIRGISRELGLSREATISVGEAMRESGRSATDLRGELSAVVRNAEAMGEDGSKAVVKFTSKLLAGVTATIALNTRLRQALDLVGGAVTKVGRETATEGEAAFKSRLDAGTKALEDAQRKVAAVRKGEGFLGSKILKRGAIARMILGDSDVAAAKASQDKALAAALAGVKAAQDKINKIASDRAAFARLLREQEKQELADQWAFEIRQAAEGNAKIAADAAKAAKAARLAASKAARGKRKDDDFGDLAAAAGIGSHETVLARVKAQDDALKQLTDAKTAAAKKAVELTQWEIAERKKATAEILVARQANLALGDAIAGGVAGVAAAVGASAKAMAPIELAMALGRAASAYLAAQATLNPVGMASAIAAGAVAVAQFGAVMGGGGGGGLSGLPGSTSGGGGFGSAPSTQGMGAASGPGGISVVFQQGVVLGTPAQIGKHIKQTLTAAHGTGY